MENVIKKPFGSLGGGKQELLHSYIVVGNVSGHPGCDKSCQIGHHIRNAEKSPSIIWGQFYMVQLKNKEKYMYCIDV